MSTPVKLPAEVENIIHHTDGVKSFIMKPLKPCPNFKPGQFLHLAIDEYDPSFHWPESRVFSIANSPLVKTAIAGEDPNWGRIAMAIGKSGENIVSNKIHLKKFLAFGINDQFCSYNGTYEGIKKKYILSENQISKKILKNLKK